MRICIPVLLILTTLGCASSGHWEGELALGFSSESVTTSDGWYQSCDCGSTYVSAEIAVTGDAVIRSASWEVVKYPAGAPPRLSDPWSSGTWVTTSMPGVYVFAYTVTWQVGYELHETTEYLTLEVLPSGVG